MSNVPMTRPDLLISTQQHPYGHTSSYLELEDGCVYHSAWCISTISQDGGETWSDEYRLNDAGGEQINSTANVSLNCSNGIGLIGEKRMDRSQGNFRPGKRTPRYPVFYRSEDGGKTWSEPIPMVAPHSLFGFNMLMDVAIRTSSGRIVVPFYVSMGKGGTGPDDNPLPIAGKLVHNQFVHTTGHFFDPSFAGAIVCYSDDDGRTWQTNSDGMLFILNDWNANFASVNEPTVTEVTPGRLLMFYRTGMGRLFQSWSTDDGESWTRPRPTCLAACTTPAQLRTLPNGHLLCVWNQTSEQEVQLGLNRTRLSSAISRDGGRVWEFYQNIESLHESTRVPPGPIQPVRPQQTYFLDAQPRDAWPAEHIQDFDQWGRWSYPMVGVVKDRVLVSYKYLAPLRPHETEASLIQEGGQRLKVLPINWFYGGKQPVDNPSLKAAYEPVAKP